STVVNAEPTLGDLFTGLTTDFSTLVRKEIELARTETTEKISQATQSVVFMVAGGMVAYAGLIALIMAAAFALSNVMAPWLATLIVALVVLIVGAILVQSGRSKLGNLSIVPEKTVESIKEDAAWAKEQVK
ncbi:MAG: phage holin family protein, partial [Chloroflexota bacterium]|nr:phage holin family protein [Chloroflexota bacterium]